MIKCFCFDVSEKQTIKRLRFSVQKHINDASLFFLPCYSLFFSKDKIQQKFCQSIKGDFCYFPKDVCKSLVMTETAISHVNVKSVQSRKKQIDQSFSLSWFSQTFDHPHGVFNQKKIVLKVFSLSLSLYILTSRVISTT